MKKSTSLPWFRMYAEFATDPKVQSMDETLQRRFIMFLCLHCSGELEQLDDEELAFALRITPEDLVRTREVFTRKGFLDIDGKTIRNWNKRQYQSDSSADRVRKHRERAKAVSVTACNVSVTPSDTDTDTDSEKKSIRRAARSDAPPEFEEVKAAFPKRAGSQPWPQALRACSARLKEGHTWPELLAGVRRYAAFCESTGKVRTEYVMQAQRFFGPNKPFADDWSPPPSRAQVKQDRNIAASLQWLHDSEVRDAAH